MTKYKLIKKYPGYDDLGMTAEGTKGGGIEFIRSDGSKYTHSSSGEKLFDLWIKPYPEYWQPIKDMSIMMECVKRFPPGSQVISPSGKKFTVSKTKWVTPQLEDWIEGIYYFGSGGVTTILAMIDGEIQGEYLYYNGKFAELVEEPQYEILSFINSSEDIFVLQPNGVYKRQTGEYDDDGWEQGWRTLNYILTKATGCKIHSIKRLSDGEIFTIGDKTHLTNGNYYNFELKEFRFFNNGESGHLEKHRNKIFLKAGIVSNLCKEPIFFYLDNIVKTKQPLFKTEDGIDIFDKNHYPIYHLGVNGNNKNYIYADRAEYILNNPRICFASKENAEEYVLKNESNLSISDIINTCKAYITPDLEASLKRIVKQKLNK